MSVPRPADQFIEGVLAVEPDDEEGDEVPDDESMEEQVARSLEAVFGEAPELVVETPDGTPPELLEVPELLRTNAMYGGG